jgi:hypothetical protein
LKSPEEVFVLALTNLHFITAGKELEKNATRINCGTLKFSVAPAGDADLIDYLKEWGCADRVGTMAGSNPVLAWSFLAIFPDGEKLLRTCGVRVLAPVVSLTWSGALNSFSQFP